MPTHTDPRVEPAAVEAAKDKLRPDYYKVLAHWAAGDRYTVIAVALGIPLGTVRSRINRGRAALAKITQETAP